MAGGIGSRFWPKSRISYPKQFLDNLGTGNSLLQSTFKRFRAFLPAENIYVVTSEEYLDIVQKQLPDHLIREEVNFAACCRSALGFVQEEKALVTLGIRPTYPNTGFGYIRYDTRQLEMPAGRAIQGGRGGEDGVHPCGQRSGRQAFADRRGGGPYHHRSENGSA